MRRFFYGIQYGIHVDATVLLSAFSTTPLSLRLVYQEAVWIGVVL